jgi:hypothetical protein
VASRFEEPLDLAPTGRIATCGHYRLDPLITEVGRQSSQGHGVLVERQDSLSLGCY